MAREGVGDLLHRAVPSTGDDARWRLRGGAGLGRDRFSLLAGGGVVESDLSSVVAQQGCDGLGGSRAATSTGGGIGDDQKRGSCHGATSRRQTAHEKGRTMDVGDLGISSDEIPRQPDG